MSIRPTQPQTVGGVLDSAFQLYRVSYTRMLPLAFLIGLVNSVPSVGLTLFGAGPDPVSQLSVMGQLPYLGLVLVVLIAGLCLMGAFYLKLNAISGGEDMSNGTALLRGLRRTLPLLGMWLCVILVMALTVVVLVIPLTFLTGQNPILIAIVAMLPIAYFTVTWILAMNCLLFEDKGPMSAIGASYRLVRGNWWRTAAIVTVAFFILIVAYVGLGMLIAGVSSLMDASLEDALYSFVTDIVVNLVGSLLVTPFWTAALVALYWDLKLRKEGGDLDARLSALNPA